METFKQQVTESGNRLLAFLRDHLTTKLTTKKLRWLIEHHRCKVNGKIERFCSYKVKKGDRVELILDLPEPAHVDKKAILFEDDHYLFYNKPPQLASNELAKQLKCFLVHRLDRDTTGVMVFAKTKAAKERIEKLFRLREVNKTYLAYVSPPPQKMEGIITIRLTKKAIREGVSEAICDPEGKEAITQWKVIKVEGERALVELHPKTGRMHQLRAHLSAIGSPIVGDVVYGDRRQEALRPLLHASELKFEHYAVSAPLPADFHE